VPAIDAIQTRPLHRSGKPPRLLATLSERDAAGWRQIAARTEAAVGPRLGPGVLGGAGGDRLGAALSWAREASARLSSAEAVLATDVRDFFPSVTSAGLHRGLAAAGVDPADARAAAVMLEGWENRGHRGLPIGPAASATLANALLAPVDAAVGGRRFLRWVDDYLVGVRDEADASRITDRIDEALAELGLARSEPKTRFLTRGWAGPWPGSLSAAEER